jgi:hypothetical protein
MIEPLIILQPLIEHEEPEEPVTVTPRYCPGRLAPQCLVSGIPRLTIHMSNMLCFTMNRKMIRR